MKSIFKNFFYKLLNKLHKSRPEIFVALIKGSLGGIQRYLKFKKRFFRPKHSVLFVGQAYYNAWYLSRELRKLGWRADLLNWDTAPANQIYYHGEDFKFNIQDEFDLYRCLFFYLRALIKYNIFHFSNAHGITFGGQLDAFFQMNFSKNYEILFLKELHKKILYTNNGCLDGVSPASFALWGPESVCGICMWKNNPNVCSPEKNLAWGKFRNEMADYQCLYGGNRIDYNNAPQVHEVPEFYCLNENIWHPEIVIPDEFKIFKKSSGSIHVYHAVGNKKERTDESGVNIKSTHIYLPLIEKFRKEKMEIELISPEGVPNIHVRYYQLQADIFLDMLTYGWYGANAREGMMLGKPVICFIRPQWLESLRQELPECAEELPIVSATPHTVEDILRDLINNPAKRAEIGKQSREFSLRWHSDKAGAKRFNEVYSRLLAGDALLL